MLKLVIEEELNFDLLAIHCAKEPYQLAFFFNNFLDLRLERSFEDVELIKNNHSFFLPKYESKDIEDNMLYELILNKTQKSVYHSKSGFFDAYTSTQLGYLIPELPKVDFFLKICEQNSDKDLDTFITKLKAMPQIITAYMVDTETLKNGQNLIFE